ncbi:hypothetical protein QAD02_012951 [Eretmocerus hayati]|uniref:Uncharacterized protein n=1 Tax=Eretmocerus hayati TaxID=131215 RepID=A0ACC2P3Q1_9HYME|nr:hypothetical protein QAD02_012951 [Eretmocerus hayati]
MGRDEARAEGPRLPPSQDHDQQEQIERHRYIHRERPDMARERDKKETNRIRQGASRKRGKPLARDTHAIIEGQIWRWNERENKPFQTGKEWKRAETKNGDETNEDSSMEHSGRQKHQPRNMGLFERIRGHSPSRNMDRKKGGSCKVNTKKEEWNIISTYMNKEKEDNWRCIADQAEEQAGTNLLILGDMNASEGEEGGSDIPGRRRKSKDRIKNTEGQKMLKNLEQMGLIILNGGQRRRRREVHVHRSKRKYGN